MKLKNILLLLAASVMMLASSCSSGSDSNDPLVGEWQETKTGTEAGLINYYIELSAHGEMAEYLPINSVLRHRYGTYVHNPEDNTFVATYADTGETLSGEVAFSDNNNKLAITVGGATRVMLRKQIPQSAIDEARYGKVDGEWKLSKMEGSSAEKIEVYLEFLDGGKCNVFQNVGSAGISVFPGTYTYSKGILSGKYTDGASWIGDYYVDFDFRCENMTLTLNDEHMVYTRTNIPQNIRDNAITKALRVTSKPL